MSDVEIWDKTYKRNISWHLEGVGWNQSSLKTYICFLEQFRNISTTRLYLELNIIALAGDVDAVGHHGHLAEQRQLVLR